MCSSTTIQSPGQQLDKISQLPDDILLKFLSKLDIKNAMRTSIIARRWRYLWTWRTDLDLTPENFSPKDCGWFVCNEIGSQGYLNWVNQVIDSHRSPNVSKLRILFHSGWSKDLSQIEKWVRFAFSKRVGELDLKLLFVGAVPRFSLGFDILKHPSCYNGIVNLRSLSLSSVDVSGEIVEFMLSRCNLLETLHVQASRILHTLNIMSFKLKHLSLINCVNLTELVIDAANLVSFNYNEEVRVNVCTHMSFRNVPKLVEVSCGGRACWHPFPILEQISYLSKQLTKLSLKPAVLMPVDHDFSGKNVWLFPNVKQLTMTLEWILFAKIFLDACPMVQEVKLEIYRWTYELREEAVELQAVEMGKVLSSGKEVGGSEHQENEEDQQAYPNLKVLEIVGFEGYSGDVGFAKYVIRSAPSFQTLICDLRGQVTRFCVGNRNIMDVVRLRAYKLAKLVPPQVNIIIFE